MFCSYGAGLVGLLTVQILKANGCRVLAMDIDPIRCDRAAEAAQRWWTDSGVNAVVWPCDVKISWGGWSHYYSKFQE